MSLDASWRTLRRLGAAAAGLALALPLAARADEVVNAGTVVILSDEIQKTTTEVRRGGEPQPEGGAPSPASPAAPAAPASSDAADTSAGGASSSASSPSSSGGASSPQSNGDDDKGKKRKKGRKSRSDD